MSAAAPEAQIARELAQYEADLEWIMQNYDPLRAEYPNHFVAVLDGRVVSCASDIKELATKLREQYPMDFHRIVFEFIYKEHPNFVLGI